MEARRVREVVLDQRLLARRTDLIEEVMSSDADFRFAVQDSEDA